MVEVLEVAEVVVAVSDTEERKQMTLSDKTLVVQHLRAVRLVRVCLFGFGDRQTRSAPRAEHPGVLLTFEHTTLANAPSRR